MADLFVTVLEGLGVGFAIPFALLFLFWYADDQIQVDFKSRFARFLLSEPGTEPNRLLGRYFVDFFDVKFGSNVFGLRFILRSFVASFLAVLTMFLVWLIVNQDTSTIRDLFSDESNFILLVVVPTLAIILNLVPDYCSLVESRLILGRMTDEDLKTVFLYLILDLVLTTAIIITTFALLHANMGLMAANNLGDFMRIVWALDAGRYHEESILGIFFYSTYFTSVWVWLHTISILLMRTNRIMRRLRNILPIQERPFRAVGLVMFGPSIVIAIILRVVF